MDITQLITAAPNLAFGMACLWFFIQIQKERTAENARYALSLEKINELYVQLLEKAVTAIANNAALSSQNGESLAKLIDAVAAIRGDISTLRDAIDRIARDNKRSQSDRRPTQGGASAD